MNHSAHFEVVTKILTNWRKSTLSWNSVISTDVTLGKTNSIFPVPDATIIDNTNNYSIAIEFKSILENKHGALTAIGQAISYIQTYSIAYIVIPENINGYNLKSYMQKLFIDTKINTLLPIGLITYNLDTLEPNLEFEVNTSITTTNLNKFTGGYWAKFRDSYPDSIWRILDIAYKSDLTSNRKLDIWDTFYNDYLVPIPPEFWTSTIPLTDWFNYSKTYLWNSNEKQIVGKKTVNDLNKKVLEGTISLQDAKSTLYNKYILQRNNDVPYKQLQKNILNFMNNLNLLDDYYYLTDTGYELHKKGKIYGSTSKVFTDLLARIILIEGKHLDLIIEISNLQKNFIQLHSNTPEILQLSNKDYNSKILDHIITQLENEGKIKRNPNRTISGIRKFLSSEFQLWGKLGLIEKNESGSYFSKELGYNFNWDAITNILVPR